MVKKAYYSARTGEIGSTRVDLDMLRSLFHTVFMKFRKDGYFDEAFGQTCVDSGFTPGTAGDDIEAFFFLKLRKKGLCPISKQYTNYSEADLFSVIELLHDLVSKPNKTTGYYHTYADCGWHFAEFDTSAGQFDFRNEINEILAEYDDGYRLSETGHVQQAQAEAFEYTQNAHAPMAARFDALFKFGLPIGLNAKPSGAVEFGVQGQTFSFQENESVGVLRGDIYPSFCMADLAQWAKPKERLSKYATPVFPLQTPIGYTQSVCLTLLHNICQTDAEKQFLKAYFDKFVAPHVQRGPKGQPILDFAVLKDRIPALLPQAWINWRSEDRQALKRMGYKYANSTMRFDFVIFWKSRNFVVQVDSIEHYAEKTNERWDASEERYAARLKEDRLLRMQGWNIFRLGNWETRDAERLEQVLEELRQFVDFQEPTPPLEEDEQIPF